MKYFRMSYEEVVFKRSYINLILLNAAIPGHKPYRGEESNDMVEIKEDEADKEEHARNYFMNFM